MATGTIYTQLLSLHSSCFFIQSYRTSSDTEYHDSYNGCPLISPLDCFTFPPWAIALIIFILLLILAIVLILLLKLLLYILVSLLTCHMYYYGFGTHWMLYRSHVQGPFYRQRYICTCTLAMYLSHVCIPPCLPSNPCIPPFQLLCILQDRIEYQRFQKEVASTRFGEVSCPLGMHLESCSSPPMHCLIFVSVLWIHTLWLRSLAVPSTKPPSTCPHLLLFPEC